LSGFFVRIPSGTRSSEGGAQKNQAAQSAAAALLRPPTPRISERQRANPGILSKLIISSIQNFA
jgi:hypothetical protein